MKHDRSDCVKEQKCSRRCLRLDHFDEAHVMKRTDLWCEELADLKPVAENDVHVTDVEDLPMGFVQ